VGELRRAGAELAHPLLLVGAGVDLGRGREPQIADGVVRDGSAQRGRLAGLVDRGSGARDQALDCGGGIG
jgi:hypothetical protein